VGINPYDFFHGLSIVDKCHYLLQLLALVYLPFKREPQGISSRIITLRQSLDPRDTCPGVRDF
jgi:hypothetical protein